MIRLASANPLEQKPDWSLSSLGMNFASGYLEGLTTFDILKEESPDTTPEYIARSLGSVLGFIGWLPTPGAWAKIGLAGTAYSIKLLGNASKAEKLLKSSQEITTLGGWLTGKVGASSIPTLIGSIGAKGMERFFETSAAGATMKFAEKIAEKTLEQSTKEWTKHLISQSVFMGFASAAAARPISFNPLEYFSAEDFKTRSSAFLEGIPFALIQGGTANAVTQQTMKKLGFGSLMEMPKESQDLILKSMRAVAAGVTMAGYTAYKNDVPLEYTIYEGLLNGVFGWREMPYQIKEANRLVNKHLPNQGVIHSDLMFKSGGNLNKFMNSKGEFPSEGVKAELDIIQTHHFNGQLAKAAVNQMSNEELARMSGKSEQEIADMTPLDLATMLERPEFERFHLLTADIAKMRFDDEMSNREKEFSERIGRSPSEEERTQLQEGVIPQVMQEVGDIMPSLAEEVRKTANRVQVAVDGNHTITEKYQEILQSLRETGISVQKMSKITESFPSDIEMQVISAIGKVFPEHQNNKQREYIPVKKSVEEQLGAVLTEKQNQKISSLWNMYANTKVSTQLVYSENDKTLVRRPGYNNAGVEQVERRDYSNYENILGIDITEINEIYGPYGRNGKYKTKGIFEESKYYEDGEAKFHSINLNKFLHSIYEHGQLLIGNKKDDHRVLTEVRGTTEFDSETNTYTFTHKGITYRSGIQDGFNQIDQAKGRTIGTSYEKYIKDRVKYVEDNMDRPYEKAKEDIYQVQYLEKAFDEMAGNRMVKWLALNQKQNLYELYSSPNSTIIDAVGYNKRMQVIAGGGIPLDPTVIGRGVHKGIRIRFLNTGLKNVFNEDLRGQEDGSTAYLSRANSGFMKTLGTSDKVAFYKDAIAVSLSTGLQIDKEGLHRATTLHEEKLIKALGEDLDQVRNDTSLKQAGDISTVYLDVDKEGNYIPKNITGKILTPKEIEKMKYDIPVSSIRLNPGVTEDTEMGDVNYLKQFFSNLPELKDHLMETVVKPSLNGNDEVNKAFDTLKTGQEVDLDKVSIGRLLEVMQGKDFHKCGPKVIAVVDKLLRYTFNKGDIIEGDGEENLVQYLEKLRGAVELSVNYTGKDNITASFLREKPIRDYIEQALHRYISDRGQRPAYDGFAASAKSFYGLTPADVINYEKTSGRKFSQGDIFLGKGLRDMVHDTPKELREIVGKDKISLGELWDMYQKNLNNKELESFFSRTIGTRSPQSDASGNRRFTVRGFMDIPGEGGYGAAVHPHDLKYLDGADNDGDSFKLFFGMDKKIVDHIEQPHIKHRFSRFFATPQERDAFFKGDNTKGLTIRQVLNRPDAQEILTGGKYLEDFAMEKGHNKFLGGEPDTNLKDPYSLFSPTMLIEAGRNATVGKNNLGWGLANANRGRELGNILRTGKIIEVDGGKYILKVKPDPEEFNRTVWDIVNRCADAADGKSTPVDYETMRIVGGVLSVADVYDAKGKLVDPQEFINHMKKVGLSKVPILKELMEVDNNTKLRDYDGNKKHLQDIFYDLSKAINKAKSASGEIDDLGSVWYHTAQLMSEYKYDPEPLDFTNVVKSDMVRRQMDRLIKSNVPIAKFAIRALGRAGVSFNNSYVRQTPIWNEIAAMYKGNETELLNDFINPPGKGSTYLDSKAWELAGRMIDPVTRKPINRQSELQSQLVSTSTKNLIEAAKLWPDKRQVIWTTKEGAIKSEVFNTEQEANEYKTSHEWLKDARIERVERTKGEQTKYIQELWQNDFKDMQSLSFMIDHLSQYIDTKLPKENLTDDAVTKLLEEEIRPFTQAVSSLKDIAIKTQEGIATNVSSRSEPGGKVLYKTLQEKRDAFQSWKEVMKKVEDYKNSLDQPKKDLFDALWLSTLNWNEVDHTPEATRLAGKEGDISPENIEKYKSQLLREQKDRYDTYRGRTTLIMNIVDPVIAKDFFGKYTKLAGVMVEDKLSMEMVADAMNISELNGNLPHFVTRSPDFALNNTRTQLDKEARQNMASFKHQFLEQHGKTREGDIADPKMRIEYKDYTTRYRKLLKDMPEQLYDLQTRFPEYMQNIYREPVEWSPSNMTWQDFKLYINYLEGHTFDPKGIPKVKQNWMFLRMPRIAEATERLQSEISKYRIKFFRPVLTEEGPVSRSPVEKILGSYSLMYDFQGGYREAKDADKQKSIELYDKAMPHNDALNKEHNNIASKVVEIVNATDIEGKYAKLNEVTDEDGSIIKTPNLFMVNRDKAIKAWEKLPDGKFQIISKDGTPVTFDKNSLRQYILNGLHTYQTEYRSYLNNRPHDGKIEYAEQEYGKNRIRLVDVEKTKKNLIQLHFELKSGQPDISITRQLDLARAIKLNENLFDVYTTPEGVFFDSQMGPEQREIFDRGVKQNPAGYYAELGKRFVDMTPAQQDAVMDQLYPDGNIMGVSNKNYDVYGDNYLHHMTLNRKTVTEYYKKMYEPLLKNLPPEEVKKLTYRMMEDIARYVNQEDDLNGGQEFMGHLYDKGNPLRSLSILPNKLFGSRNMDDPIPDWELGINASITAHEILLKTQHDMTFALMSHFVVNDARKNKAFGPTEGGEHMINWLERYARQTMGFQDTTPPELPQGYNYGLKHNWMKFYNNKFWNDKITEIGDSWFGKKVFPEYKQVQAIADNLTFVKEKKKRSEMTDGERQWHDNENTKLRKQWVDQVKKNLSDKKISWLSQAEAKWSLMSLLTSFKTAVTNVTSAEIMTFINSGGSAYTRSFKLGDIQAEFGKDVIRNRGDIRTILQNLGGLESFFYNEAGMDPSLRKGSVEALTEIIRQASNNDWKDVKIRQTIKDAGLMDILVNRASWFMRSSERVARERSMLSHYINARRVFRQAGFELEYDDPWIMQIAREGVKSSQFLYSNGERPEFMSTPMGKIFHRFQLYAYNSVEFRYNTLKAAQMTGIGPGSDDLSRFNRMMAADLFMFGMASLVPFSVFGSSLQAPYNGLQSSLKYMFGTDDEKRRSFFSALPYPVNIIQPIVPPGLREIPQLFGLFVPGPGGVSQKLEDMVVSALPFQRIGKDIGRTIENPTMVIDNMTGIPFIKLPQISRDLDNITTFNEYINRYRDRASLDNKKMKKDINQYLDQYPSP
jgi:hypothetical protein